jgi:hypothetical protein
MSNKPKAKKQKTKQMAEKNYQAETYRPDSQVVLSGEDFAVLRQAIFQVRDNRLVTVVQGGSVTAMGMSRQDFDIDQLYGYVEALHKKQVDAGNTVDIEVLRKELEEEVATPTETVEA